MIRIVVGDKTETGLFPYRIDGHWGPEGAPLVGICENPMLEACRILAALGVSIYKPVELLQRNSALRTTIEAGLSLPPPLKRLAPPRRKAARKRLVSKGSGIPGDGV